MDDGHDTGMQSIGGTWQEHVSVLKCTQMASIMNWIAPQEGENLPPLWHWLFCNPAVTHSALGYDGHEAAASLDARLSGLHRMWAAGDVDFLAPVPIGATLVRKTILENMETKVGRTGPLTFVNLRHEFQSAGKCVIRENQILVYRVSGVDTIREAVSDPSRKMLAELPWQLDDLQLFRYSALTFNSHRIHLDRRYCKDNYGEASLVAHGPLLATILAKEVADTAQLSRFSFRALYPIREGERFQTDVDRNACSATIRNAQDVVCMRARFKMF